MKKNLFFIFTLMAAGTGLFAQNIGEKDVLELFSSKVTSASRYEQDSALAPGAVTIITSEEIEKYGFSSIADILRLVPGANVRWTPMGETVGFRSFGQSPFTDRVRFLINGIPYNSPLKGGFPILPSFLSFFPMEHIKRVEVIRGASSALYGANAFWGVVNIVTKTGEDFNTLLYKKYGEGSLVFEGGSRETQKISFSYGQNRGTDFQWSATGRYQREDGILNYIEKSLSELKDVYADLTIKDFTFSILHHDSKNEPVLFTDFIGEKDYITPEIGQRFDFAGVSWRKAFGEAVEVSVKGSFMQREGAYCHVCHSPQIFTEEAVLPPEKGKDRRIWGEAQINCRATEHHYIIGGIEAFQDNIIVPTVDATLPALSEDEFKSVAVFLQDEISLLREKLFITLGGRYDHHETRLTRSTRGNFSPRVSVVYSARPFLIFRTSFNRAYKQPSWNDLFGRFEITIQPFENFRQLIFGGRERVKEERIDSFEAGADYYFSEKTSLKFNFFYDFINDFIYYHSGPQLLFGEFLARYSIIENFSQGTIESRGAEIELRRRWLDYLQSTITLSFQDLNLEDADFKAPNSPGMKCSLGILFGPWESLSGSLRLHYVNDFYPSNLYYLDDVDRAESFSILDTKVSYRLPFLSEALEISLIGRNLLDRHQIIPPDAHVALLPGREFFIQARLNF